MLKYSLLKALSLLSSCHLCEEKEVQRLHAVVGKGGASLSLVFVAFGSLTSLMSWMLGTTFQEVDSEDYSTGSLKPFETLKTFLPGGIVVVGSLVLILMPFFRMFPGTFGPPEGPKVKESAVWSGLTHTQTLNSIHFWPLESIWQWSQPSSCPDAAFLTSLSYEKVHRRFPFSCPLFLPHCLVDSSVPWLYQSFQILVDVWNSNDARSISSQSPVMKLNVKGHPELHIIDGIWRCCYGWVVLRRAIILRFWNIWF